MPSSSDQKPMIYVQTLGGFSIKQETFRSTITETSQKSHGPYWNI